MEKVELHLVREANDGDFYVSFGPFSTEAEAKAFKELLVVTLDLEAQKKAPRERQS